MKEEKNQELKTTALTILTALIATERRDIQHEPLDTLPNRAMNLAEDLIRSCNARQRG
jgi:hypothetical protein